MTKMCLIGSLSNFLQIKKDKAEDRYEFKDVLEASDERDS